MRPLVSYDDIASQAPQESSGFSYHGPSPPPKKRRKSNHQRQGQRQHHAQYSRNDSREEHKVHPKKTGIDYGLKEESRQLTHEEVWDDTALIHAWDAAVEEYEVLNGPDKKWKTEPVNKSALWFNIPPEKDEPSKSSAGSSILMPSIHDTFSSQDEEQEVTGPADPDNSRPVNFDTFVPRHDPSLPTSKPDIEGRTDGRSSYWHRIIPPAPAGGTNQLTRDQAFEQVVGAWYWAGYWTGVYHTAAQAETSGTTQMDREDDKPDENDDPPVEDKDKEAGEEVMVVLNCQVLCFVFA
ncbi:hypothetical protein K439DRAFT_548528 [Ramaria rubella]|nr:hypothetical protein K439DRAFT_548528 [Ramaria rubella]